MKIIECLVDDEVLNVNFKVESNEYITFNEVSDELIKLHGFNVIKSNIKIESVGSHWRKKLAGLKLHIVLFIYHILGHRVVLKLITENKKQRLWVISKKIGRRL